VLLVRHGRTPWAATGRHTGRSDIALDEVGEAQARALGASVRALRGVDHADSPPALVLASPLSRALRTAQLGGLDAWGPVHTDEDLVEWDYGAYEGLTTAQVRQLRGDQWRALRDGIAPGGPGQARGESLEDLARRCAAVLTRITPVLEGGDVILVGHGHALRVLAATWLELPPRAAERLHLEPASICVLGHEHGVAGVERWNVGPGLLGQQTPR
jgi:probable phosphoglycerate mutase